MYRVELKDLSMQNIFPEDLIQFLMYRVELKEHPAPSQPATEIVPNVPCGVERLLGTSTPNNRVKISFLMYRVELKVLPLENQAPC